MCSQAGQVPAKEPRVIIRRSPLDAWVAQRVHPHPCSTLDELRAWQVAKVREALAYARERSRFYASLLSDVDIQRIRRVEDMCSVPFTLADDIIVRGREALCVSLDDIQRIVTLSTSGTTASPKRLYFTKSDLELTVDFFAHGMSTFTRAGDRCLVLMPGERPGSVGNLLSRAIPRLRASVLVHGPVTDPAAALDALLDMNATVIVGIPTQVLTLVRWAQATGAVVPSVHSVLLSADHAARSLRRSIESGWGCSVFDHYGSTEMGYGGGVECSVHDGYHLRLADLLFEIVDPTSGRPLPAGRPGEIVVTTLTRTGMPLIRYRTGDLGSLRESACRCGSPFPSLTPSITRIPEQSGAAGHLPQVAELDEALFALPMIADYRAEVSAGESGLHRLEVELRMFENRAEIEARAAAVIAALTSVRRARVQVVVTSDQRSAWPTSTGMMKRSIASGVRIS